MTYRRRKKEVSEPRAVRRAFEMFEIGVPCRDVLEVLRGVINSGHAHESRKDRVLMSD